MQILKGSNSVSPHGFLRWIRNTEILEEATSQTHDIDPFEMADNTEGMCTDQFAILVGLCQSGDIPAMAVLVPDGNGIEFWRRMHARYVTSQKTSTNLSFGSGPCPIPRSLRRKANGKEAFKNGKAKS